MSNNFSDWILYPEPNENANLRLFCIYHAGGSGMVFRTWPRDLPGFIEVCAVELPGHGRRIGEVAHSRMETLAAALVDAMLPEIDKPYALFGHSFGALVCFEAARKLQNNKGLPPTHLCVSGVKAPQLLGNNTSLHKEPDSLLIDHVRRMGGTPEAILENEEMVVSLLPAIRADYEVLETYEYTSETPLKCPILAMAGSADPQVDRTSLQAWGEQTTAGFSIEMFPGDHFFLYRIQPQVLQVLGTALKQALPVMEDQ